MAIDFNNMNFLMKFFYKLGAKRIAWSLRRLYVPVDKDALVLEVGSGGKPYYRANVLLDLYEDTIERFYDKLIIDRPTVLASVEKMPFKNDVFDFVIASHVLEHSKEPEKFIAELQRVAKAGYIETPCALFERLTCYSFHTLEIDLKDGELIIEKKRNYINDYRIKEMFENSIKDIFPKIVSKYPFHFMVRHYWSRSSGGINYRIINPEYNIDWQPPIFQFKGSKKTISSILKANILNIIRILFSQNKRNSKIDLINILKCNRCNYENLKKDSNRVLCPKCNNYYKIINKFLIDCRN